MDEIHNHICGRPEEDSAYLAAISLIWNEEPKQPYFAPTRQSIVAYRWECLQRRLAIRALTGVIGKVPDCHMSSRVGGAL